MRNFKQFIFSLEFLYILLIAAQVAAIIFLCAILPSLLPVAIIIFAVWLAGFVCAFFLFTGKAPAEVKCALYITFFALPLVAPLIYAVSSVKRRKYGILRLQSENKEKILPCGTVISGYDKAEYFSDGTAFFAALEREILSAGKFVYLEFYIFARGQIFEKIVGALEKARARGVDIKIIIDGVGSALKTGRRQIKRLKGVGEVKTFNRLVPLPLARHNARDHRKIAVIDGKTAFTGGINIADEYANITSPYGYWKDSGVAIYGNAAQVFKGMFLSMWQGVYEGEVPAGGRYECVPFCDSPPHTAFCEDALVQAISSARQKIYLLTPYFSAGEKLCSALRFAALRGVDVKVILPKIPDKKRVLEISKAYAHKIAQSGAKFYRYTPGFMHAKAVICDNGVFLGSYNFDYRSTHFNYECGVYFVGEIYEKALADFNACLALSEEITAQNSRLSRFKRLILRLFAPLV